jgi:hypothetical protein
MSTAGVSGGPITQALTRGRSLRVLWLRNRLAVPDPLHYSAFFPVVPYSDSTLLYVTPVYNWGPTIMWLPPLGSIPPRPLKPVFLLESGTQKFYVGQSKKYVDLVLSFNRRSNPITDHFLPAVYSWHQQISGPGSPNGWQIDVNLPQ